MKYFPIYISLISLVFVFASCSKDLEIPLPQHEAKLTLYSFLTEDEPIDLYVTRSFGILEKVTVDDIAVKDATVELYKNDQLIDVMVYKDTMVQDTIGVYTFSPGPGMPDTTIYDVFFLEGAKYFPSKTLESPKIGDTFRFVVSHPSYGTVQAETKIPEKAMVSNIRIKRDSLTFQDIEGYEMKWTALKMDINDPVGEGDAYNFMVGVDYEQRDVFPDTTYVYESRDWRWPGTEILRDPDGYTYTDNKALTDEGFDGQLITSLWWIDLDGYNFGNSERVNTQLNIRALSLTKSYAKFQEKLRTQTYNRLSGIESAFVPSEPVVIPSNVEGGYGIVGAFTVSENIVIDLR